MTLYLRPDRTMSTLEQWQAKQAIASILRQKASQYITGSIDVRDVLVGGTTVTTAQTSFPVDPDSGSAVDLVEASVGATVTGWAQPAAGITAYTVSDFFDQTKQVRSPRGKILAFYGVIDYTASGDLQAVRFSSGQNTKAFIETEHMYELSVVPAAGVGGFFFDDVKGTIGAPMYGLLTGNSEAFRVQGIWTASAAKSVVLRCLVAEKSKSVITASGEQAAVLAVPGAVQSQRVR